MKTHIPEDLAVLREKSSQTLLTYQYLTFGILPRILAYQPGFWHIHRESVSGWGGFSLGVRSTLLMMMLRTAAVFVPWI